MTEDGQYDLTMQYVLTGRMKFIVVNGRAYVSSNMTYHNGVKFTKIITILVCDGNIYWFLMTTS